ncbi:MAG: glycine cleavage system protein T [Chloroflexi bacterium HGW-Chloroflexi-1]|nr:MAG: glycine cleavage system protein T [Chloroflexi bacterium HGW-Chloroflexi-1]
MPDHEYWNTFLGAEIGLVDPDTDAIIGFEEERQARKLIMIPSESIAPKAVRQALGSVFNNVYAEGYPPLRMTREDEETILDFDHELAYYRRYGDRRFYKGVDYVHFVETLAQRRCADTFANERVSSGDIYVNVQPLSGAAANLAVYDTVVQAGDTVMGMDLYQGGHLTHGSEFNFSGKRYHVVPYGVSKTTGKLDYDELRDLARRHRPKMMIAGFTSYTWAPDWQAFAAIAHEVGALLLADISHPAGMVAAGAFPSPVGIADVITFTTHKTLCGPRGAVIVTTDEELARRVDLAVFPGEQGGPHPQKFAAMAVMFKIAQSKAFRRMMFGIEENAAALADGLVKRGLGLAYGGTDSHFCMLDLNSVGDRKGSPLRGEPAVRILDMAGIVANKNTIPGDTQTGLAMGIRLGAPWLTQRGFGPAEMDQVAGLIHKVVTNIRPFSYMGLAGELPRGKIELDVLEEVKAEVAALAAKGVAETENRGTGYPHYYMLPNPAGAGLQTGPLLRPGLLLVTGERAESGLNQILTCDVGALAPGEHSFGFILNPDGRLMSDVAVMRLPQDERGRDRFILRTQPVHHERVKAWLRGLGDGYIIFDRSDLLAKVEGPLIVEDLSQIGPNMVSRLFAAVTRQPMSRPSAAPPPDEWAEVKPDVDLLIMAGRLLGVNDPTGFHVTEERPSGADLYGVAPSRFELRKPYFVGQHVLAEVRAVQSTNLPIYQSTNLPTPQSTNLPIYQRTPLYEWHKAHTTRVIPFAGWEMPVWYTGVLDEHNAVRKHAGLFDVAHMGVFEISGPHATEFLDLVCTNYVRWYAPGESFYSYFLDPDGKVIDDLLVYRRARDKYLMVVNASNADKDWAWINAVNRSEVLIDRERPDLEVLRPTTLRNLKDPSSGPDMRVDLALQGPASLRILQSMVDDPRLADRIGRVRKTGLIECNLAGFDLVISRTGYTGEDVGYELFIHPDRAVAFWETLLEAGKPFGLQPCGLAARDSTRTEAGLPLYGHELAGHFDISPVGAGFPGYVKLHKPYFIGRAAHIASEKQRTMEIARFRMNERGVRMPKTGDPVINKKGQAIGYVTSAAVDVDGVILGLAYIQSRYHKQGDRIGVFSLPAKPLVEKANKANLQPGDKLQLPDGATLLRRFPDNAERSHWRGKPVESAPGFLPAGE